MKLLTKELIDAFPELYANEEKEPRDIKVIAKFFCPWNGWTWYATEFDGKDLFFGLVKGLDTELGYFTLTELESVIGPGGLTIERDLYFGEHTLNEFMEESNA